MYFSKLSIMELTPVSNNRLTLLRKLNSRKYRQKEQLFIVEGERAVAQVIKNGLVRVDSLYFDAKQELWNEPAWTPEAARFESFNVEQAIFGEITDTDNPQGILALCQIPSESTSQDLLKKEGIIVAADGIQDPGNMGTMIRTASWFGVQGILAGKGTVDLFHPKVVRGTAGATGSLPFINAELETVLPFFEQEGWRVILMDTGPGAQELRTLEQSDKVVLVVGNEANGVSSSLFSAGRLKGCITSPASSPAVESLNASIALSIALYAFSG